VRFASHYDVRPRRRLLSLLAALGALGGCFEPEAVQPPLALARVDSVPSPAGEGSEVPHLSSSEDGVLLSWLQSTDEPRTYRLLVASFHGGGWSEPAPVVEGDRFFVNWADFPSVVTLGDRWLAHWLERGGGGTYDYGVRVSHSDDRGRTWSEPWTPHEDGTPTEHGFVSLFPMGAGAAGLVWLDGRETGEGHDGSHAGAMTLRYRGVDAHGTPGAEELVDGRICDCCQTDVAVTGRGPVAVYRDRTEDEIRDIYVTRRVDGAWTEGRPVHRDGWETPYCPVNGPAIDARGDRVVVAWFTGALERPRVKVAFSGDAGASFAEATVVDDGNPTGRVDVVLLDDGSAAVSWLERTESGGEGAEIRVRRVGPGGAAGRSSTVATSNAGRPSGFPRMVSLAGGDLLLAWTDSRGESPHVRVAVAELAPW